MDATVVQLQLQLACCVELCCASFGNVKAALGASKMPWHAPAYDTHTQGTTTHLKDQTIAVPVGCIWVLVGIF